MTGAMAVSNKQDGFTVLEPAQQVCNLSCAI